MKKNLGKIKSLNDDKLNELADILRLMGDPSRLKIIIACVEKQICVTDIIEEVGFSQSLVSHHLRLLKATGLLKSKREGRQIFYEVNGNYVRCIIADFIVHVSN